MGQKRLNQNNIIKPKCFFSKFKNKKLFFKNYLLNYFLKMTKISYFSIKHDIFSSPFIYKEPKNVFYLNSFNDFYKNQKIHFLEKTIQNEICSFDEYENYKIDENNFYPIVLESYNHLKLYINKVNRYRFISENDNYIHIIDYLLLNNYYSIEEIESFKNKCLLKVSFLEDSNKFYFNYFNFDSMSENLNQEELNLLISKNIEEFDNLYKINIYSHFFEKMHTFNIFKKIKYKKRTNKKLNTVVLNQFKLKFIFNDKNSDFFKKFVILFYF